jgi:hypothetical protein
MLWTDIVEFDVASRQGRPLARVSLDENGQVSVTGPDDELVRTLLERGVKGLNGETLYPRDGAAFLKAVVARYTSPYAQATAIQSGEPPALAA